MTPKEKFINEMKARTKAFAVDSIKFCDTLKKCKASDLRDRLALRAGMRTEC